MRRRQPKTRTNRLNSSFQYNKFGGDNNKAYQSKDHNSSKNHRENLEGGQRVWVTPDSNKPKKNFSSKKKFHLGLISKRKSNKKKFSSSVSKTVKNERKRGYLGKLRSKRDYKHLKKIIKHRLSNSFMSKKCSLTKRRGRKEVNVNTGSFNHGDFDGGKEISIYTVDQIEVSRKFDYTTTLRKMTLDLNSSSGSKESIFVDLEMSQDSKNSNKKSELEKSLHNISKFDKSDSLIQEVDEYLKSIESKPEPQEPEILTNSGSFYKPPTHHLVPGHAKLIKIDKDDLALLQVNCSGKFFPAFLKTDKKFYFFRFYVTFDGRMPTFGDFDECYAGSDAVICHYNAKLNLIYQKLVYTELKVLVHTDEAVSAMMSISFTSRKKLMRGNNKGNFKLFSLKHENFVDSKLKRAYKEKEKRRKNKITKRNNGLNQSRFKKKVNKQSNLFETSIPLEKKTENPRKLRLQKSKKHTPKQTQSIRLRREVKKDSRNASLGLSMTDYKDLGRDFNPFKIDLKNIKVDILGLILRRRKNTGLGERVSANIKRAKRYNRREKVKIYSTKRAAQIKENKRRKQELDNKKQCYYYLKSRISDIRKFNTRIRKILKVGKQLRMARRGIWLILLRFIEFSYLMRNIVCEVRREKIREAVFRRQIKLVQRQARIFLSLRKGSIEERSMLVIQKSLRLFVGVRRLRGGDLNDLNGFRFRAKMVVLTALKGLATPLRLYPKILKFKNKMKRIAKRMRSFQIKKKRTLASFHPIWESQKLILIDELQKKGSLYCQLVELIQNLKDGQRDHILKVIFNIKLNMHSEAKIKEIYQDPTSIETYFKIFGNRDSFDSEKLFKMLRGSEAYNEFFQTIDYVDISRRLLSGESSDLNFQMVNQKKRSSSAGSTPKMTKKSQRRRIKKRKNNLKPVKSLDKKILKATKKPTSGPGTKESLGKNSKSPKGKKKRSKKKSKRKKKIEPSEDQVVELPGYLIEARKLKTERKPQLKKDQVEGIFSLASSTLKISSIKSKSKSLNPKKGVEEIESRSPMNPPKLKTSSEIKALDCIKLDPEQLKVLILSYAIYLESNSSSPLEKSEKKHKEEVS